MSSQEVAKPYFIHFGCWNSGKCDKETGTNGLSQVMTALQKEVAAEPPAFIVVAGDNYYPDKDKSSKSTAIKPSKTTAIKPPKKIDINNLKSGFDCLPTTVPIYMLLGNHDLENVNNCQIIKEERVAIENKDKIQYIDHGTTDFGGYRLVMIDTNVFLQPTRCYKKGRFYPKNDKKEKQKTYVLDQTKTANKIVLIGHHPIDYIVAENKHKKPDAIAITTGLVALIQAIFSKNTQIKDFVYLCADNHYFQASTITLPRTTVLSWKKRTVRQFIVGTGGAELDNLPTDMSQEYVKKDENKQTNIQVHDQKSEYGYAKCFIGGDGKLQCEFVPVPPPSASVATQPPVGSHGGGSRRFRKKNRITKKKHKSSRPKRNNRRPV